MVGSGVAMVTPAAAASVSVAQVLQRRASGRLTESEIWALLCQAAQALQDLFLARKATISQNVPRVCPSTLRVTRHGRVTITPDTATGGSWSATGDKFLAPEYNRQQLWVSDASIEKMWIFSLGVTLQAAVTSGQGHDLSGPLRDTLAAMTVIDPGQRASLMDVLDVISEYCKCRPTAKPFSHIAMEMWRGVLGTPSPVTQCLPPVAVEPPVVDTGQLRGGSVATPPGSRTRAAKTPVGKSCSLKEAVRRHPVQRAPSRLYRAVSSREPSKSHSKYTCPNTCIGPEFVVRAAAPVKRIHLGGEKKSNQARKVIVILLTGQRLEINCDPSDTTAGQIYEVVLQVEKLEDNFTLGLAALLTGDFVFLGADTRLCKVAPNKWGPATNLTLYLRVKFFLPSLRGVRKWTTKHLLYLQLRRSLLEQQIRCDVSQHVTLGGLALQAEFGDFCEKEHGCGDYFILDHYIPEMLLHEGEENFIRLDLQQQHRDRRGNDPGRAEEIYIGEVQKLNNYGSHFYSARCVDKKKLPHPAVWIAVSGQGIFLYDKCDGGGLQRSLIKFYVWRDIQKLCYSKQYFLLHPSSDVKGVKPGKHKYLMDSNKSFFVFQLASLHHQFFMKLRIELSSLQSLSVEFGVPLKRFGKASKTLFYVEDNTPNDEVDDLRTLVPYISQDRTTRSVLEGALKDNTTMMAKCRRNSSAPPECVEEIQNKENESPEKQNLCASSWQEETRSLPYLHSPSPSETDPSSYKTTSYPRRLRVKMGTRAFLNTPRELFTSQDTVTSPPSPSPSPLPDVYVLNSSIKSTDERFHLDFHETLSDSLIDKFDNVSFAGERILRTLTLRRDSVSRSLGIQIREGCDGGVYIRAVTPGGAAALQLGGAIHPGDQLIAVDGHTLLNRKYLESLQLLQASGDEVELVLSQVDCGQTHGEQYYHASPQGQHGRRYSSGIDLLSEILQKPIEDSYLKTIRYETAVEIDAEGNDVVMVSSPIPRVVGRRGVVGGDVRGWRSPQKGAPAYHGLRGVCCVMPVDEDHGGGARRHVFI